MSTCGRNVYSSHSRSQAQSNVTQSEIRNTCAGSSGVKKGGCGVQTLSQRKQGQYSTTIHVTRNVRVKCMVHATDTQCQDYYTPRSAYLSSVLTIASRGKFVQAATLCKDGGGIPTEGHESCDAATSEAVLKQTLDTNA